MKLALFDRVAEVKVISQATARKTIVRNLRISFRCNLTADAEANSARVSIYNMAESTRNKIGEVGDVLELWTGYRELSIPEDFLSILREKETTLGTRLCIRGNITSIDNSKDPPDIVTQIEIGDGVIALRESLSNLSAEAGTQAKRVLQDLLRDLPLAGSAEDLPEDPEADRISYPQGFSFVGPTVKGIEKVVKKLDWEFSVQNMVKIVNKVGEAISPRAILVSPRTGLLETPSKIREQQENMTGRAILRGWRVRTLMNPIIKPRSLVRLQTDQIDETLVVETVEHFGDTRGQNWFSNIDLIKPGSFQEQRRVEPQSFGTLSDILPNLQDIIGAGEGENA